MRIIIIIVWLRLVVAESEGFDIHSKVDAD